MCSDAGHMAPMKLSCSPVIVLEFRHCISAMLSFKVSFACTSSGQRIGSASMHRHSRRFVSTGSCRGACVVVCAVHADLPAVAVACVVNSTISSVGVEVTVSLNVIEIDDLASLDVSRGPSCSEESSSESSQADALCEAGRSQSLLLCCEDPQGCPPDFFCTQ